MKISAPTSDASPATNRYPRLVFTKLLPPPLPQTLVRREQLLRQMRDKPQGCKLILVQAPAGFGKTTLLLQYLENRRTDGAAVLWLSLDNADNDLDRFALHLHAGWKRLIPAQPDNEDQDSFGLIEQLASYTQPFTLILDEFEVLQNPAALHFVQQLIGYLPANGELVIGSRHVPELGVGRLRARNQLMELSHAELRLSLEETSELLQEQHALTLKNQEIAILHERTEGWVAAIHLAALALPSHRDPGHFLTSFSGSHAELAHYLAEDILDRLSASQHGFLLQTCILSQLNTSLCNYIGQRHDSQAQLDSLARTNLFLIPLNNEHSSYRYHGLFASFLLDRLKASQPQNVSVLHRRAADWYLQQGSPITAIDHLLHDQDQQAAIALLSEHAAGLLAEGRVRRLLRWFELLSPAVLRQHPKLHLTLAWALVLNRRHAEAQSIIDDFLQTPTTPDKVKLVHEARTVECLLLSMTDQFEACYRASSEQLKHLPLEQSLQYGVLASIVAYCMIATNRYDEARQTMSQAMQRDHHLRTTFIRSLSDAHEGWIDLTQGRLGHALTRLQSSYERAWSTSGKAIPGGKAVIGVPLAEVLYEMDELDRANRILGECLAYARENGTVDALISSYLLLSRIAGARGDRESSLRYLKELEDVGLDTGLLRVSASAKLESARQFWLQGDLSAAENLQNQIESLGVWPIAAGVSLPAQDLESPDLMRWRLLIARGETGRAESELKQALKLASSTQRHRRALKLRILLSSALLAAGKSNPAMQMLTEALKAASKEGFIRIFLEEGSGVTGLLIRWFQLHGEHNESVLIAPHFLASLRSKLSPADLLKATVEPTNSISQEQLTKRELEVLCHLAEGERNRTIADKLFVSETTIKAHLRSINAKLGAHGRTEAVAIARREGLI
ncbi:LuxR C-terminal-related transcriptional regulator [Pseudomonas sp. QLc11A]|uniref:LuxR C-terminal-related transcriptional regulator n=1 Tax=Pseudomonas azerbaijanorientalis TaxID=2842350 RepID=A0ABW8W2S6_9PSED